MGAQTSNDNPAFMRVFWENGRIWHMNCVCGEGSGIMKTDKLLKEEKKGLVRCMSCGKKGYLPFGVLGGISVPEVKD